MKKLMRRIASGVVIFSFFLPWFDFMIGNVNGFIFIKYTFELSAELGEEDLTLLGLITCISLLGALLAMITSHRFVTYLFLVPSTINIMMFYNSKKLFVVGKIGIYVYTLGVVVGYVSLLYSEYQVNRLLRK